MKLLKQEWTGAGRREAVRAEAQSSWAQAQVFILRGEVGDFSQMVRVISSDPALLY